MMQENREILFRGKRLDNNKWVEGDLEHNAQGGEYIRCRDCGAYQAYKIVPDTRGEYTGLTDKNGVKIFEGDIIAGKCGRRHSETFEIWWNGKICSFVAGRGVHTRPSMNTGTVANYEVVGNVHDNPELLKSCAI